MTFSSHPEPFTAGPAADRKRRAELSDTIAERLSEEISETISGRMDAAAAEALEDKSAGAAAEWPELPTEEGYSLVYHGKLTDNLALMRGRNGQIDKVTKALSLTEGGVTLTLPRAMQFGTSPHKLLTRAVSEFTKHNASKATPQQLRVSFSIEEWAQLRKEKSLTRRPASTPEEAAAEDKRLSMAMDNFIRKTNKDLQVLHGLFSFEEKVKGKPLHVENLSLIGFSEIKRGFITIEFTLKAAEYLVAHPLTQYGDALYAISDRHPNAYILGLLLVERYNIENNQIIGTADRIMIEKLLDKLDLMPIEKVRKERRSWEAFIKDRFEDALEALVTAGLLTSWEYCKAKGVPLTDQEAQSIIAYEDWSKLYVHFSLVNAPDHSKAIEASKERAAIKAAEKKKTARKRRTATKKKAEAGE